MTQYIALLRGINVSGKNKVAMADLRTLFTKLGFDQVQSFIQTGNVLFSSERVDREYIRLRIEQAITEHFGFIVPVQLRTHKELQQLYAQQPYSDINIDSDGNKGLISFLSNRPDSAASKALCASVKAPEILTIQGDIAYLYCPNGYGKSKITNAHIEKKLGVQSTTRNLKTLRSLCDMAEKGTL